MSLSEQWKTYIREWISIENIVANKEYNKTFLLEREYDSCNEKTYCDFCNMGNYEACCKYKIGNEFKCVSNDRIKTFNKPGTIIESKEKNLFFKILESKQLPEFNNDREYHDKQFIQFTYYYILQSTRTKYIYILFPTGSVLDIFENTDIKNFLQELVNNLLNKYKNSTKIILSGHSYGCVLALYTGILLQSTNNDFFENKCIILGSGPYQFIKKNDTDINTDTNTNIDTKPKNVFTFKSITNLFNPKSKNTLNSQSKPFKNLPNVKIFVSAIEIESSENKLSKLSNLKLIIDSYFGMNPNHNHIYSYSCYEPLTFLSYKISDKNKVTKIQENMSNDEYATIDNYRFLVMVDKNKNERTDFEENVLQITKEELFQSNFHSWENYSEEVLLWLFVVHFHSWESYNMLFNSLLKTVGGKKYTRHKRKNNKRKSHRKKIISRKRF